MGNHSSTRHISGAVKRSYAIWAAEETLCPDAWLASDRVYKHTWITPRAQRPERWRFKLPTSELVAQ